MRERAGDVLEVWVCVAAWVDAPDARQLYRCSVWLLEGVEHSWRAREREEHHSRAENVMPSPRSVALVFSTLWLDLEECVSVTTAPPHSYGQLFGCKTVMPRHQVVKASRRWLSDERNT